MVACAWYWRFSALFAGGGIATVALNFNSDQPWILVGLTSIIVGATVANTGFIATRARSLDEEFDAGYEVGYRAGRRAPKLTPVQGVSPIRRAANGLSAFNKAVGNGGLPKAPLRAVAGNDPAS